MRSEEQIGERARRQTLLSRGVERAQQPEILVGYLLARGEFV